MYVNINKAVNSYYCSVIEVKWTEYSLFTNYKHRDKPLSRHLSACWLWAGCGGGTWTWHECLLSV